MRETQSKFRIAGEGLMGAIGAREQLDPISHVGNGKKLYGAHGDGSSNPKLHKSARTARMMQKLFC